MSLRGLLGRATYAVAEMTRRHVTVALNGDAGTRTSAVTTVRGEPLGRLVRPTAGSGLARAPSGPAALLPRAGTRTTMFTRGRRFLEGVAEKPERRYARWFCHFYGDRRRRSARRIPGGGEGRRVGGAAFRLSGQRRPGFRRRHAGRGCRLYLPDDLLVKVDIASMAHALEARSPSWITSSWNSWPPSLRSQNPRAYKKYILKRALRGCCPRRSSTPKKGFGVPIGRWIRKDLKDLVHETSSAALLGRDISAAQWSAHGGRARARAAGWHYHCGRS